MRSSFHVHLKRPRRAKLVERQQVQRLTVTLLVAITLSLSTSCFNSSDTSVHSRNLACLNGLRISLTEYKQRFGEFPDRLELLSKLNDGVLLTCATVKSPRTGKVIPWLYSVETRGGITRYTIRSVVVEGEGGKRLMYLATDESAAQALVILSRKKK